MRGNSGFSSEKEIVLEKVSFQMSKKSYELYQRKG